MLVPMKVKDKEVQRGVRVAKRLGWPAQDIGRLGAFGSLGDFQRKFVYPRSTMVLLHDYVRQGHVQTIKVLLDNDLHLRRESFELEVRSKHDS